jgi:SOS-response transcriptional repressor LexA
MTLRQNQLLLFIRNKVVHGGSGPTYQEMKDFMNVTSNKTIEEMLKALIRDCYISINRNQFRGIRITSKGMGFDESFLVQNDKTIENERKDSYAPFLLIPNNASSAIVSNQSKFNMQTSDIKNVYWRKGGGLNGTK